MILSHETEHNSTAALAKTKKRQFRIRSSNPNNLLNAICYFQYILGTDVNRQIVRNPKRNSNFGHHQVLRIV